MVIITYRKNEWEVRLCTLLRYVYEHNSMLGVERRTECGIEA